jgi:hypothetical protein
MDKRFQVFVSSTYADLQDERTRVMQTLMEMDCIPSGMELFPAMDEDQFEFIKKIIDDCDYYLLIIGGRYGSVSDEGVSYTEKEYDYAVSKGLKVLAFLHQKPDDIPVGKTDKDDDLTKRLMKFREKAQTNRLVRYWKAAPELPGLVSLSLLKTIKMFPAVGWVRGDAPASNKLLEEVNELRKENEDLRSKISLQSQNPIFRIDVENIADLDHVFKVDVITKSPRLGDYVEDAISIKFCNLFLGISSLLEVNTAESMIRSRMESILKNSVGVSYPPIYIDDLSFQSIKAQFILLGLVDVKFLPTTHGNTALFWFITEKGKFTILDRSVVRVVANSENK